MMLDDTRRSVSLMSFPHTDVVFVNALQLTADVGLDCWNRQRAQPVYISVYVNLHTSYLSTAGRSDNVQDSINYGTLSKAITTLVEKKSGSSFDDIDGLINAVTREAYALAEKAATEVRVEIELPKLILLAGSFHVEVATPPDIDVSLVPRKVVIEDLIFPVIIGVNPPERNAKQRVVISMIVLERPPGAQLPLDYPAIVSRLSNVSFLTGGVTAIWAYSSPCSRILNRRHFSHWKSSRWRLCVLHVYPLTGSKRLPYGHKSQARSVKRVLRGCRL
jgi:FolB domain-containing protein